MWKEDTMANHRLKNQMLEVVNNQLKDNNPKFVKETLSRLVKLGYSEKDAREMIAAILLEEIYYLLKDQENYNEERYSEKLSKLPEYVLEV
jgi:Holliday junction resolvasome RuvABC DNA-binding subunit